MADAVRKLSSRCRTCGERFPADYVVCPRDATPLGAESSADPLLGLVLAGAYRVTRLLARGGMGRLYEAEHVRLPRQLAVKVIHDQYADHPDAVARFEREARAAASVRSDHVLDVLDVLRTPDDRPCIVAEKLEGEDLQSRLDRHGPLALADAIRIGRQLCRGLAAAHAAGVVHRDLKPSNVFLAADAGGETVKILDFGVAKLAGSKEITRDGAVVGTPAYMAPEQARGASSVDERADVYGVGAVLYRALTGHAPFEADDAKSSLVRLLEEDVAPARTHAPELPEEVEQILSAALARDPKDRPQDALELERALRRVDPAAGDDSLERDDASAPLGDEPADTTLVLPRGSVAGAALEARRLRRARPIAFLVLAAASLASGAAIASLLSATVRAVRATDHLDDIARWLLAFAGATAVAGIGSALAQLAKPRWSSSTRLRALTRRTARALVAALAALGAGTLALAVAPVALAVTPSATAEAAVGAVAIAVGTALLTRAA